MIEIALEVGQVTTYMHYENGISVSNNVTKKQPGSICRATFRPYGNNKLCIIMALLNKYHVSLCSIVAALKIEKSEPSLSGTLSYC